MKKISLYFLILHLMLALNLSARDIRKDTQHMDLVSYDLNLDSEVDDCTLIECTLHPIQRKSYSMVQGETISNSLNWSGYTAITGTSNAPNPTQDSVTHVSGSWTVPTLIPNVEGDTFSSAWVGIDGYVSPVVEQIGTEHDVINGSSNYFAWFSLFPAPTQVIDGFPVNPGDVIEGRVTYKGQDVCGNSIFRLTIKNCTQKVKFSTTQHTLPGNPAHLSSAEWIVEAPGIIDPRIPCLNLAILPLANFKSIFFNKCKTIINKQVGSIDNRHYTFDAITMVSGSIVKATPSALGCLSSSSRSKKNCFSVNWANPGPFPYQVFCPDIVP